MAGLVGALLPTLAAAQAPPPPGPHLEPPPDPAEHEPLLLVDVSLGYVAPLERRDICPGGEGCVLGPGGALGVLVERRWPIGIGIFLAYDVWFVEGGGVFELGTAQVVRAGVRFAFLEHLQVHPTLHIAGGALVFGDSVFVSTVGGAVDAGTSVEVELTDTVGVIVGAKSWIFTTVPFTSPRDDIPRSGGSGVNVALQLYLGLSIVADHGTLGGGRSP